MSSSPSNPKSPDGPDAAVQPVEGTVNRQTLPPPEWAAREGPKSAASIALAQRAPGAVLRRWHGQRAEYAALRGRLAHAQTHANPEIERAASAELARALAAQGTELDIATKLARRALLLADEPALRDELAAWFAGMGEPALAAVTLRPLLSEASGARAAQVLIRIAVLLARADDAVGAVDALSGAVGEDASDPLAPELLGAIGAWAPSALAPIAAAEAYLEGARRRHARNEHPAAFDDLLRAFAMAPELAAAANQLAAALITNGREGAADEVLRDHADALGDLGRSVHLRRMLQAAEEGQLARALGAAFDARLEGVVDVPAAAHMARQLTQPSMGHGLDELLARVGLHELLAARLERAREQASGAERAQIAIGLGRLYAGVLRDLERATHAWVETLVADPTSDALRTLLHEQAAGGSDILPLAEALLRIARDESASVDVRVASASELAAIAEERLGDPALASWVLTLAQSLAADPDRATKLAQLTPRAQSHDAQLDEALASLELVVGPQRGARLERIVAQLQLRVDRYDTERALLSELMESQPHDHRWRQMLARLMRVAGRWEELEQMLQRARQIAPPAAVAELSWSLATLLRARGEFGAALTELRSAASDSAGRELNLASMALVLATELGDDLARGEAIVRLSAACAPAVRAVLLSVGAEVLAQAGNRVAARQVADLACRADPSLARPAATRARIALLEPSVDDANALERAVAIVVPRASLCAALAELYAQAAPPLAVAWTQRWLVLRPGDPRAAEALLLRAQSVSDDERLAEALTWFLSQPQPLETLTHVVATALTSLSELNAPRAAQIARRALNVLGPRSERIREAVITCAERAGDQLTAIAVLERWLAVGAEERERMAILFQIARRRALAGELDAAMRALVRAIRSGATAGRVLEELESIPMPQSPEGQLAVLEVRAEALSRLGDLDAERVRDAWRELGAALWDLADDRDGALRAWERAARLDPERGALRLAQDLALFCGHDEALARLEDLTFASTDPKEQARFLAAASTVALHAGKTREALQIATRALTLDASRADVLAVAERAASPADIDVLEGVYERLAEAALGCYGERAVHYRAARQLERRDEPIRALVHAVQAFEAVPAEGVSLTLLARLARRSSNSAEAVRALERVAGMCEPALRAAWLRRAASLADDSESGRRQRVDVLLKALAAQADVELLRSLGAALASLVATFPGEREVVALRFERAIEEMLPKLAGPEGARVAIEAAHAAVSVLGAAPIAFAALDRAIVSDGDVDEYARMTDQLPALASEVDSARALVTRIMEASQNRFASSGRALLELGARLADQLGDAHAVARLLVVATKVDPDDVALRRRARSAARQIGDAALIEQTLDGAPPEEQLATFLDLAATAERNGDVESAIGILENLQILPDLDAAGQRRVTQRLMELYRVAGRVEAYEGLVRVELERQDLPSDVRARLARDLAASLASRGEIGPALDMLVPVAAQRPRDEQLQEELLVLAERLENTPRRIDALRQLVVCSLEEHTRLERLRTLAALLEEQGDEEGALPYYAEIALLRPEPRALVALERDAERRGDYAELVGLFARRAALASSPDEVRRIRLRRAAVLEQRLGKPEDARNELEGLLRETGEHLSVLRMLADSNERLGSPERAAPLWEQASKLASSLEERVELRLRAARAHHQAGDLDAARAVLQRDAEVVAHPAVNDLVKTLDREAHDPTLRAQSFERLAAGTAHPANARAQWLVEAAHAYISAGDLDKAAGTAEGALRLAPNLIDAQLTLRWCKHLENGPGSAEQARLMVAELRAIRGVLTPQQAEVRTFLIAEALDAAVGAGAGLRELRGMEADLGPLPLIALGIAERQEQSNPDAALGSYEQALQGDLRQARAPGAVAMAAASLARRLGKLTHALEFLERAAADPSTREAARDLEYAIRAELERPRGAASAPNAAQLEAPRAPTPLDIERLKWPQTSSPDRILSPVPAPHSSPPGGLQTPRDATETVGRYSIRTPGQPEPVSDAMSPAPPSSGPVSPVQAAGRYSAHAEPEVIGIAHASPRGLRSAQEISSPRIVISHGLADAGSIPPADDAEAALLRELLEAGPGAVDAGRRLIGILEHYPDRTHDLVTVCRRVVELLPGDQGALERLHAAARADKNFGYARAIEHVMSLTSASGASIAPPPLSDQPEQPELVRAMLFRDTLTNGAQALAFVWEGAEHVFRRDATAYGITGLERVQLGAPMPLARVYSSAARALGATRTALYQRRTPGSISLSVALMSPPAVIISGEIREESSALRFHLGAMLTAAMSEYALLFGTSESEARAVLRALALAFGPPQRQSHGSLAQAANLAEVLWESVPARSQRRLRELCDVPDELEYEVVMESAWHALRRAGLFVCGDLEAALRETCSTLGLSDENLRQPGGLAALCAANEAAKDLVSLATSPMYAETRWQPARGGGQRHSTGQWVVH